MKVRFHVLQRQLRRVPSNCNTNAMLQNPFQDSAPPPPISLRYFPPQPFLYTPHQLQQLTYPAPKEVVHVKSSYAPAHGAIYDGNVSYAQRHPSFNIGAWHYIGHRSNMHVSAQDTYPLRPSPPYSTYPDHYLDMIDNNYYSSPSPRPFDVIGCSTPSVKHRIGRDVEQTQRFNEKS